MKKMQMRIVLAAVIVLALNSALFVETAYAQVPYDDVAVIVNTTSTTSAHIGEFFAAARNIPAVNIIPVAVSSSEEIDAATFDTLRMQVESYLQAHGLTDVVNYLVTTKGVPLKVNRGSIGSSTSPSSSVESELALILGPYSQFIGQPGRIMSPCYNQTDHFSRSRYGVYLVTRLDGYTIADIEGLIQHGGPNTPVSADAVYLLDQDPSATAVYLNSYLASARNILAGRSKNVCLNVDSTFVTRQSNVVAYMSWGSNDRCADLYTENARPFNTWARGAIAETFVSTSARSFEYPAVYGQSLIADLIAEGVSGVKGYVYEPYSSAMANASILLDRYTSGYNLAESYSMASAFLSWMDVVIGDPKTSILQALPGPSINLASLNAACVKESRTVVVSWTTRSEINTSGFAVQRFEPATGEFSDVSESLIAGGGTSTTPRSYQWIEKGVRRGDFSYRLRYVDKNGNESFTDSVRVSVGPNAGGPDKPPTATLAQNYPNPFNPTTVIRYTIDGIRGQGSGAREVRLVVYDVLGREVKTLVNETKEPGTYNVQFDSRMTGGQPLASGVYIYRLVAKDPSGGEALTLTKEFLLVK